MATQAVIHRPRLGRAWEILELADGSICLNAIYGKHLRIAFPAPWVAAALRGMDGSRTIDEIEGPPQDVRRLATQLQQAGALDDRQSAAPPELDPALEARFFTFIDHLQRYATPWASEYEYFARLRRAHVCVLGVGGAGSIATMILAAAGVGRLTLVDGDTVELQNLVRQPFYTTDDVGRPKAEALAARVRAFTPHTEIDAVVRYVDSEDAAAELIPPCDFLLLCADAPRFLLNRWINRVCLRRGVPNINGFSGSVGPLCVPGETACFECVEEALFRDRLGPLHDHIVAALQRPRPRPYPSCVDAYMLNGRLQARECIAVLTGAWEPATATCMHMLRASGEVEIQPLARRPECPECGHLDASRRVHRA